MQNSLNVTISPPALYQILTLCQKWPNLEWSGYCLHEKTGNVFEEQIIVHAVYLMDVGSAAATDFKGNADIATLTAENPEIADLIFEKGYRILQCKMHSHHKMEVFYSKGVPSDQDDLETNSENQDVYLSIVTNNKLEFFAKACRWVKTEEVTKSVQVLNNGKYQNYTYTVPARKEKIIQEVKVKLESDLPAWFTKRLTEIKPVTTFKGHWNNSGQYSFDDDFQPLHPAPFKSTYNLPAVDTDDEYTFEDEIITVFSLPKDCEPSEYLKTNKVDVGSMISNLMEYTTKEEDGFWDALGEWLVENELVDSKFGQQMKTYLTHVVK